MKVILTGATGMVGEGVLFECLENSTVTEVLVVGRKHYDLQHPKLKELIVPDFLKINDFINQLTGYDACFYCAGISSVGMKEEKYTMITYDTTMVFARALLKQNSNLVFNFVSGKSTDSTGKGKIMWARVKGKTENDLMKLGFKSQYNFRPGAMLPFDGQKNANKTYTVIAKIIKFFSSKSILTLSELGKAMIHATMHGYPKQILETTDINALAK